MAIEAWYMDDKEDDQRAPHKLEPNEPASHEILDKLGVLSWTGLDADNYETDPELAKIREERGYSYSDCISCSPDKLPNYDTMIARFFEEHIHTDEEIRYCLDGSGYFDVRDLDERWIRIQVRKGDLIILPAGIYHRFTLDESNFIKALRLFVGEPVWTPYNRPQDEHPVRQQYVEAFAKPKQGTKNPPPDTPAEGEADTETKKAKTGESKKEKGGEGEAAEPVENQEEKKE